MWSTPASAKGRAKEKVARCVRLVMMASRGDVFTTAPVGGLRDCDRKRGSVSIDVFAGLPG
jgi:hypothetical protein